MQISAITAGQTNRPAMSARLKAGIGVTLSVLLVSVGFWFNAGADGTNQPAPPKSLMGTSVATITVDGYPGVVVKELLTLSPDGGEVGTFNQMVNTVSYFVGRTILGGPLHGNWRWSHGSDTRMEGFGVHYLFDAETQALFGHESVKWWMTGIREDGAHVSRWESKTYDLQGNLILTLAGDAVDELLTETTPVN